METSNTLALFQVLSVKSPTVCAEVTKHGVKDRHIAFIGPPGNGQTQAAYVTVNEMRKINGKVQV